MASVTVDKRTGNLCVRAYGGKDTATGRVHKPSMTLPADASEDDIARAKAFVDMKAGVAKRIGGSLTIGGLVGYYLDELCPRACSPSTVESYESNARCYVYPTIGDVPYDSADPGTFSSLYERMAKPKDQGGFGVSQRTVKKVHSFLSGCFNALVAEKVLDRNIVRDLKVPRGVAAEAKALEHGDFDRLLDRLFEPQGIGDEATLDTALIADAYTGMRRGEIAGLLVEDWYGRIGELRVMWAVVQVKGGALVRKGTKRGRVRFVAVADEAAERIARHVEMQAGWLEAHGVRQTGKTPLFATSTGGVIAPRRFYERFAELKRELGIDPSVSLKSLRHTQATYLLEDGENVKLIQQRMGHASQSTTVDIYSHVMPGKDRAAANRFGEIAGRRLTDG